MDLPTKPEIMVYLGIPGTGKSVAIKALVRAMAKQQKLKFGICICPTAFNGGYDWLPKKWVWDRYDEAKLERYVGWLRDKTEKVGPANMKPNFVILDDCLGRISWNSDFWSQWISTFRHTNTTILISAQSLKGKGTSMLLRDCTSRAFMFHTRMKNAMEGMYDAYGQIFPSYEAFKECFLNTTRKKEEHKCLVYVSGKDSFEETYFGFTAPLPPAFKLEF